MPFKLLVLFQGTASIGLFDFGALTQDPHLIEVLADVFWSSWILCSNFL